MTRTATLLKNRISVLRLKHQVKGLNKAAEGQLELLGALALTHRPPTVDIAPELAELSGIQGQVGDKQTTIGSLRQTSGSGSVVKELNKELAELQARQRTVTIGIGRKAAAARAEMPGATGAYAAMDRLNAALATKQAELAAIEDETAALTTVNAMNVGPPRRPVLVAATVAGVAVCLGVLWILWGALPLGGGVPKSIRSHMSADTQWIAYCNLHALRKTPLWSELQDVRPPDMEVDLRANWAFGAEDIREAFVFAGVGEGLCAILRTYKDVPLDEAVLRGIGYSPRKEYEGYKYTSLANSYGARTGRRTYLETQSEDLMKDAIVRLRQGQSRAFSANLERAIANVAASDYYLVADSAMLVTLVAPAVQAMTASSRARRPFETLGSGRSGANAVGHEETVEALTELAKASLGAEYIAMALKIRNSLQLRGHVAFRRAEDAAAFENSLKYLVDNGPNLILASAGDDPSARRTAHELSKILRATTIRVRGNRVDIDAQVEMDTAISQLRHSRDAFARTARLHGL